MGKYKDLIDNLFVEGKFQESAYITLAESNTRAISPLVSALLKHNNPNIRETCAEILSERKTAKAIPALIEALLDESLYVRQDALWAIESISGYQPGKLQEWLKITNVDPPRKLYKRISEWWQLNRRYIEKV